MRSGCPLLQSTQKGRRTLGPLLSERELIQHVPKPRPPPPHSCLEKAAPPPPTPTPLALFSGHSAWKPLHSCQLPAKAKPSVPQDPVTVFFSLHGPPRSYPPQPPALPHFSKPSSRLVFPKLTNLPPSFLSSPTFFPPTGSPGFGERVQEPMSSTPLPTSCPLRQQAPFLLTALSPNPKAFVHFWTCGWATLEE